MSRMSAKLLILLSGSVFLSSFLICQSIDRPLLAGFEPDSLTPFHSLLDSASTSSLVAEQPIRWYTFIQNIPRDWSQWAQTTFRQDEIGDWALVGGLTAALFVTDDMTYTPSKHLFESSDQARDLSNFAAEFGDGSSQFALAGALAAYGLAFNDQRALRTGSQIVEVVLGAGAVVQVLKHVTGRESPFTRSSATGIWKFFPDQLQYHKHVPAYDAFPSGHICTSVGTVVVVAENYPEVKWIRPVGYLLCTFIAVGMVNNGIHWYSDYPLGIFLGYSFGMIATHQEMFSVLGKEKENSLHISLAPAIGEHGAGLSLRATF
jgi:PAP2 superfamily